jgi:AraC-like DNA-binding protein
MDKLFHIFHVNEDDVKRINSAPNEPHSHDYEELIIGMEGSIQHFIDYRSTLTEAPLISFVAKGKIHRIVPGMSDGHCSMWVIRFKGEFISETIFQLYAHYHDHANIKLQNGVCFDRMNQLCTMMYEEMQMPSPDLGVVSHLLNALFFMVESERKKLYTDSAALNNTQNITFKNFLNILEENFRRPEGVEYYAEKLFMTSRNLNLICNNILNQSVSEIIENRKMTEAKNLLMSTGKSISEIGFELGFQEKSYFTNVFKRKSGQTPSEFRAEMKKQLS